MNESFWQVDVVGQGYETVAKDYVVDVVVIGAGITGATAAYLLKRIGKKVALVERDLWGMKDSGFTTAHVTCVTDEQLTKLVRNFGRDHAAAAWDAGVAAIEQIEENIKRCGIDCDFVRVPGYRHASLTGANGDERAAFMEEAAVARELGFDAEYMEAVPFMGLPGMRVGNQAWFHPRKYLAGLIRRIPGGGSHVFEQSEVTDVLDVGAGTAAGGAGVRMGVKVNGHIIGCNYVVVATHYPIIGKALVGGMMVQSKVATYSTYVVGARVAKGTVPSANFWDTSDPYYYLRIQEGPGGEGGEDWAILGGEDHKTGQESDTEGRYARLEAAMRQLVPGARVEKRWSGQVVESSDGLPLMGEVSPGQYVATGFTGQGMTFGTLGGMMALDAITMRANPWKELFDVNRVKVMGGAWDYVKENLDYPFYMIKDRLLRAEGESTAEVGRGTGRVIRENGRLVAVYREEGGKVVRLSPVCQHMGCIVRWNGAEKTWDCPCHGSRYRATGEVVSGPAEEGLVRE